MAKTAVKDRPAFRCAECGWSAAKWVGRCGECQAWGTVDEVGAPPSSARSRPARSAHRPGRSREVDVEAARSQPDRGRRARPGARRRAGARGGGPARRRARASASRRCCSRSPPAPPATAGGRSVVTGEESAAQVRLRAERIGALDRRPLPRRRDRPGGGARPHRRGRARACWSSTRCRPSRSADVDGAAGGVTQVREVAAALIAVAKERGIATVLVGHVTKDGSIAGPRVLEHLVDVVLSLRGRAALVAAAGPGGQEPLRRRRRGRLLRPAPTTASSGCPTRRGLFLSDGTTAGARHLRDGHPRGPPPAGRRGAGAGRRVHSWPSPRRATSGPRQRAASR